MINLMIFFTFGAIDFYVDPIVYRSSIQVIDTINNLTRTEDIFYLEFNCEIPYNQLQYETIEGRNVSRATIAFKISDLNRKVLLSDTIYRQFSIPSFAEAIKQQMTFLVQFGIHVPAGQYHYSIDIISGDKQGSTERDLSVELGSFRTSDILLASSITSDSVGDYLRKGSLRVVPIPSHRFTEKHQVLYFYYEIYDIVPDTSKLEVMYKIENKNAKLVRKITRQIDKKFASQMMNFGFDIRGLAADEYRLIVEVNDSLAQIHVAKEVPFQITRVVPKEITFEGMPYYEEIEYFVEQNEYRYFSGLPKEGRAAYLKRFWENHNYYELAERFSYADEHFKQGDKPGFRTERGRIYVRYGAPDNVGRSDIEYYESRPYELWEYYDGTQFLFLDVRRTNEYTLVWTNAIGEQSQPGLYKYIPPIDNLDISE